MGKLRRTAGTLFQSTVDLKWKLRRIARRLFRSTAVSGVDFRIQQRQLLLTGLLHNEEKALLKGVSLKLHPKDDMYRAFSARHYLSVGLSAQRCINEALSYARNGRPVKRILDFPCGHGRVLRFLRRKFPDAEIVACEIDPTALKFCEREFSVSTVLSNQAISTVAVPGLFDLIWSGSLLTHLRENDVIELLRLFYEHLAPGGLCVFTTHGPISTYWMEHNVETYGLSASACRELLSEFNQRQYGYADYHSQQGYGIAVVSHDRMVELAGSVGDWTESVYFEQGWDNHQDVYGFSRAEANVPSVRSSPWRVEASDRGLKKRQGVWPSAF
ncbi:MAG TPA: class I SAM-dependent methyltransferase [Edaphobacter sp.]